MSVTNCHKRDYLTTPPKLRKQSKRSKSLWEPEERGGFGGVNTDSRAWLLHSWTFCNSDYMHKTPTRLDPPTLELPPMKIYTKLNGQYSQRHFPVVQLVGNRKEERQLAGVCVGDNWVIIDIYTHMKVLYLLWIIYISSFKWLSPLQ